MDNVQCDECLDDAFNFDSMNVFCQLIQMMEMLNMTYREMKNALLIGDISSIELLCDKCDGVTIYDQNIYDFTYIFDAIKDFKDAIKDFKSDYKDDQTCL